MRPRTRLPRALQGQPFHVRAGAARGVSEKRMRGSDLQRPFHAVRVDGSLETLRDRCAALCKVLGSQHVFSHLTAAELWGMPLPHNSTDLHVTAIGARGRIRRPGIVGWERADEELLTFELAGVPVLGPSDVWCQLATQLSRDWLVAVGDFLISGERTDFGRRPPLCTIEQLAEAVERHGKRRGSKALRWALGRLRAPVDSPRESLLRLALIAGGLPEPEVQLEVDTTQGRFHGDLGYRGAKLIIEYQGDEHRVSRARWLKDLTRVQLLEDAGFRVVLVGADDLRDGARALIARIGRILASDD